MRFTGLLWVAICGAILAAACGSDESTNPKKNTGGTGGTGAKGGTGGKGGSAGSDGGGTGGSAAGSGGSGGSTDGGSPVARGEYLVRHVAACGDCHTPRKADGSLDESKWLAGVPNFADLDPADTTKGAVSSRNLTSDPTTGLGGWTDAQIKSAFLDGVDDEGKPLVPVMPYFVFHNMTADDADAIVAYLRTVPPVVNQIPENQPLPFPLTQPAAPVPVANLPQTSLAATDANYESAQRGRYLAANIGVCMECHTERSAPGTPVPLDLTKLFAGGEVFPAAAIGLPSPPWPAEIVSANITPAGGGIQGWSPQNVATAIKTGMTLSGDPICPPMPAGPAGAFGGMTDQDALDIGNYLTTIAPIANGTIPKCVAPAPAPDGGTSDAASD